MWNYLLFMCWCCLLLLLFNIQLLWYCGHLWNVANSEMTSVAPQSHGFDCVAGTITGLTSDLSLCTRLRKRWSQGPFSVVRKVQGLFLFHVDGTYNWIRNVFSWSFLYSLNCKILWKYDPSIIFKGKEFLFFLRDSIWLIALIASKAFSKPRQTSMTDHILLFSEICAHSKVLFWDGDLSLTVTGFMLI